MLFILLTFLAAFSIEAIGTYVSVIGLSTLFGANPIIIALAVALDVGKLVVVSLLYTYWNKLGKIMKTYALIASFITMVITSAGAAGYLSGEFQKAILGTQEVSLKVDVLKQEQLKLEERKKQIDNSIAAIPDRYTANQKIRLMNQYKAEQKQVTDRLNDISKALPDMQIQQIGVEAKAGPILYISKAFDVPVEVAVKWVILMIIFVFDPLAVFLIIAGNFLLDQRRKPFTMIPEPAESEEVEPEPKVVSASAGMAPEPIFGDWSKTTIQKPIEVPEAIPSAPEVPPVIEEPLPEPVEPELEPVEFEPIRIDADDGTVTEVIPLADAIFDPIPTPALEPEPVVETPVRETITMGDLIRPHSSLHDVKADPTVTFDESPQSSLSVGDYRNLR